MPVCCKLAQAGIMQGRPERKNKNGTKWGFNLKYGRAVSQSLQTWQTIGLV